MSETNDYIPEGYHIVEDGDGERLVKKETNEIVDIGAILKRVHEAHPGPYSRIGNTVYIGDYFIPILGDIPTAEFFAHAKYDALAMLARIAALESQLSTLTAQLADSRARVAELEAGKPTSIERLESAEAKHTGMRCDVVNMLFQAGLSNRQYQASLNQLGDHLTELTTRWLAGDEMAIAEFVALYCISGRCKKPANAGSE